MLAGQSSIETIAFKITRRFLTAFIGTIIFFLMITLVLIFFFYMDESITVQGTIEPSVCVFVRPQTSGTIKEVFVSDGEYVEKGKLLAEIDDVEQKADSCKIFEDLEIAENNLFNAEQELRLLQLNNGDQIEQAEVSLKQAQMELENEVSISNLSKTIYGEISQELKLAEPKQEPLELRRKKIAVEQAQLNLKIAQDNKTKEILKQIEAKNLRRTVSKTERELELVQSKLQKTKIYSSTNGYILTSDIGKLKGLFVSEGQNLLKVGDFSSWVAKVYVPEHLLPKIVEGQKARLYVKAYPYEQYRIFNGVVKSISFSPVNLNDDSPLSKTKDLSSYIAVVDIEDFNATNGKEKVKLYDGMLTDVKIVTRSEKILSILSDKLFFTSAKFKDVPLRGSK